MCGNPVGQCLLHGRNLVKTAFFEYPNRKPGFPLSTKIEEGTSLSLERKENPQSWGRKVRDRSLDICPVVSRMSLGT